MAASMQDRIDAFAAMADRRFYDYPIQELIEREKRILVYEQQNPGHYVRTFEEYQRATGDDNEARFVRWQVARDDADERLHRKKTGNY